MEADSRTEGLDNCILKETFFVQIRKFWLIFYAGWKDRFPFAMPGVWEWEKMDSVIEKRKRAERRNLRAFLDFTGLLWGEQARKEDFCKSDGFMIECGGVFYGMVVLTLRARSCFFGFFVVWSDGTILL